ncbi:MAG: PRD domain-containing protein [Solobacterium sp.]|nr:PRD domain-containing protein [Solobacterium sp.]
MRVIRCINNNVAVCQDTKGQELIAFGKGVGFRKPPYEISLSQIERTYYDVDATYLSMINDIPEEVLNISDEIVDYARILLPAPLSSNIIFTLADHLNFCIQRYQKHMNFKLPIIQDIEQLFENEMKVGIFGLKMIREKMGIYLPREEAAYIALHLINYEEKDRNSVTERNEEAIENITKMIEQEFEITINREDFNYSRFVSHMHYFFKRGDREEQIKTTNEQMYQTLVQNYPKTHDVSEKISRYLEATMDLKLTDEEKMYLMLHINRLSTREDCYQE